MWLAAALYVMAWGLRRTHRRERGLRRHRHERAVAALEWDLDLLGVEDPFYRWPEDPRFASV